MIVKFGDGQTHYGPGVSIELTADELAKAVNLYLYSQDIIVDGPRTISYEGELLNDSCKVYVDPEGTVVYGGKGFSGRGNIY